jgi:hypothetical protein
MKTKLPPVLAVMQNQWFRNPDKVRSMMAKITEVDGAAAAEEYRRRVVHYALFAGCLSGRVLEKVFGKELCAHIRWDEASREIGAHASDKFPPDIPHLRALVAEVNPAVIICFGQVAKEGISEVSTTCPVIFAPHPAARHASARQELEAAAVLLRRSLGMTS